MVNEGKPSNRYLIALPLVALGALTSLVTAWMDMFIPLWYDELFTYYVSLQDTPSKVVGALLNGADNNSPLDYLARHFSMKLLGYSPFAFRLPSLIAFLGASTCLYLFVRKRTSFFAAAVAFAAPLCTLALAYSYEGRPYMLMLLSMALSLLAWQRATVEPSFGRLSFLAVSLSMGPFSHFLGVFNYAPIVAGEIIRAINNRKVCWPILLAIGASLVSLFLIYPFARNAAEYTKNFWTIVSPSFLINSYQELVQPPILFVFAAMCTYLLVDAFFSNRTTKRSDAGNVPAHEIVAAISCSLIPALIYLFAILYTNAVAARYAISAVVGLSLLASYATHQISLRSARLGVLVFVSVWLAGITYVLLPVKSYLGAEAKNGVYVASSAGLNRGTALRVAKFIAQDASYGGFIEGGQPTVLPHSLTFLASYYYLPSDLKRQIYFIADRPLAVQYRGFDTDAIGIKGLSNTVPMNVFTLCEFLAKYSQFSVIGTKGWLRKKLMEEGIRPHNARIQKDLEVFLYDVESLAECELRN